MKTSVVLSAYNGEKYIFEQLESIRTQTVPVNEVLIFDDCSSDETSKICSNFIKIHGLSNWKFVINTSNKGFTVQNMMKQLEEPTLFRRTISQLWQSHLTIRS